MPIVAAQRASIFISGMRPPQPWWPLPAIKKVEAKLNPGMTAIEFGSGSSTIWLGKRVRSVLAREHNAEWARTTRDRLREAGLENCDVQHRTGHSYFKIEPDLRFDFAVIDGEFRWKCLEALADKMNPGGLIYFDNSDSDKDAKHYSEFGLNGGYYAQAIVSSLSRRDDVKIEEVTGMINGELFAGSGLLILFH